MSLHTMKKKSSLSVDVKGAMLGTSDYNNRKGFTLNGGIRNLNYVGKSSSNSVVRTPFIKDIPVNYRHGQKQEIIYGTPQEKANIRKTPDKVQSSIPNIKSMIQNNLSIQGKSSETCNSWVKSMVLPNSSEHTKELKIRTIIETQNNYSEDYFCYNECFQSFNGVQLFYIPYKNLKRKHDRYIKAQDSGNVSSAEYTRLMKLQFRCLNPICILRPFPFYINRSRKTTRAKAGSFLHDEAIYYEIPEWYFFGNLNACNNNDGNNTHEDLPYCIFDKIINNGIIIPDLPDDNIISNNVQVSTETYDPTEYDNSDSPVQINNFDYNTFNSSDKFIKIQTTEYDPIEYNTLNPPTSTTFINQHGYNKSDMHLYSYIQYPNNNTIDINNGDTFKIIPENYDGFGKTESFGIYPYLPIGMYFDRKTGEIWGTAIVGTDGRFLTYTVTSYGENNVRDYSTQLFIRVNNSIVEYIEL
jgi:hypothetical protein